MQTRKTRAINFATDRLWSARSVIAVENTSKVYDNGHLRERKRTVLYNQDRLNPQVSEFTGKYQTPNRHGYCIL